MDNIQRTIDAQGGGIFNQAEVLFDDLFIRKAPPLPAQMQDLLVKLAPFWAILLIVLGVLGIVFRSVAALFSVLGALISAIGLSGSGVIGSVLGVVDAIVGLGLGLVALLFLVKSLPGLFTPRAEGWRFLFRAEMILVINSVVAWVLGLLTIVLSSGAVGIVAGIAASLFGLAIGAVFAAIGFYLLFQIKSKYR